MRAGLLTIGIMLCLALFGLGTWGYITTRINLRQHAKEVQIAAEQGYIPREDLVEQKMKRSIKLSTAAIIAGLLGLFIAYYNLNSRDWKKELQKKQKAVQRRGF